MAEGENFMTLCANYDGRMLQVWISLLDVIDFCLPDGTTNLKIWGRMIFSRQKVGCHLGKKFLS